METIVATNNDLSLSELEDLLKEKKKAAKLENERRKKEYETFRDETLTKYGNLALELVACISSFKKDAFDGMNTFRDKMVEYGTLVGGVNNKGSFSIKNDEFKIEFSTQIIKAFDERATLAEEKMKLFLTNFIKKRDKKAYVFINGLMERNEQSGDFDIGLLNRLYKMEDQYDDPNWKEAIKLFKESYSPYKSAQYIRFFQIDKHGSWQPIVLDFAKAKF